jgi:hypothetical protein
MVLTLLTEEQTMLKIHGIGTEQSTNHSLQGTIRMRETVRTWTVSDVIEDKSDLRPHRRMLLANYKRAH